MLNWDINNLNLIHDEMLKQAEKDHLAEFAVQEIRKTNHRYNPTLAWVGRRFVDIGAKLVMISGSDEDKQSIYEPEIHLN